MKLVIAEKPSVGMSIAKVLKAYNKQDGYTEGSGYIVSWCVGHLVSLADAADYDPKYKNWNREDLPIIPKEWKYKILQGTSKQFQILKSLMNRNEVEEIIEATDAGREGELIFRLVYMMARSSKPIQRLWLSSMEDSAIRKAFASLKPGIEYNNLYQAALCRQKADWIVGISGTRLFSTIYNKKLAVGRVMTPTLSMIVERDKSIQDFRKEKFYILNLDCVASDGSHFIAASERFSDQDEIQAIKAACSGREVKILEVKKERKTMKPPHLFDLTTLQRTCNRIFGYTAQKVLDTAQNLYEKKMLTYPRTDSSYITTDLVGTIPDLVSRSIACLSFGINLSPDGNRLADDSKVSDHHALLPTKQVSAEEIAALSETEKNVLMTVMARLIEAVSGAAIYENTVFSIDCSSHSFSAKGRTTVQEGWKSIEAAFMNIVRKKTADKAATAESDQLLPTCVENGDVLKQGKPPVIKEGFTSPPKAFTEDTLLSAMEHASEKEFAEIEDLERSGLGTPATRAAIIEKLVNDELVNRSGRTLSSTIKGKTLISLVPEQIKSPSLTAEWEKKLKGIEKGQMAPDLFMKMIQNSMEELVSSYKKVDLSEESFDAREIIGTCPRCGSPVVVTAHGFRCRNKDCSFMLWKNDRFFTSKKKEITKTIAKSLLKNGKVIIKDLWSEKKEKTYSATVVMKDTGDKYVNFELEFTQSVSDSRSYADKNKRKIRR